MNRWNLTNRDNGDILELPYDPDGWEEITLTHERDEKWHGVFYGFSQELGFYCNGGGKEFVDAAYDSKGQEANVRCVLETFCNGTWDIIFDGKVNFSSYRQEYKSNVLYTFLNVENDDITTLLKNREDTNVDLLSTESLSGVALNSYDFLGYDLNLHSKTVRLITDYSNTPNYTGCIFFPTGSINNIHLADWTLGSKELRLAQTVPSSIEAFSVSETTFKPLIEFSDEYDYPFDMDIAWDFAGNFQMEILSASVPCGSGVSDSSSYNLGGPQIIPNGPSGSKIFLVLKVGQNFEDATGWALVSIDGSGGSTIGDSFIQPFDASGSITVSVNQNDKVWLMWMFAFTITPASGTRDVVWEVLYDTNDISFTADTLTPASTGKAIAIHEAWSRLSESITDQPLAFKSELFGRTDSQPIEYTTNGCGAFTAISSGLGIRNFVSPRIETTLKDMFESCNAVWGCGLGVEKHNGVSVVRVDSLKYYYSDTILFTLNNIPGIEMQHIDGIVYNEIEAGYDRWETESRNGIDEPNTSTTWSAQFIKQSKNKFTALSTFMGGMYPIEITRRLGVSEEDGRYDENMFFICLNRTTSNGLDTGSPTMLTTAEKDENFVSVNNLISPETAYNLRIMPNNNYARLANQFTSGFVKQSPNTLKLSNTEGNFNVTYQMIADGCEGDYFGNTQTNVSDKVYPDNKMRRGTPLWMPEEYTFSYPLTFTQYKSFLLNPRGKVRFSDSDKNHKEGWVNKLEYNLKLKTANFTIIRSS